MPEDPDTIPFQQANGAGKLEAKSLPVDAADFLAQLGITGATDFPVLVFDGDSVTSDSGLTGPNGTWPKQFLVANPIWRIASYNNVATNGATTAQMITAYPTTVAPLAPTGTQTGFYFLLAGTNDLGGLTPAAIYDNLKTLWALARADGFKVVALTIQPSSAFASQGKEADRLATNVFILSDPSLYDYAINLDYVLSTVAAEYIDGIHPTAASNIQIARTVSQIFNYPQILQFGTGSPESVIYANIGNLYRRVDGTANTAVYIKTTNGLNTGWKAIGTGTMASQDASSVAITNGTINATMTGAFSGAATISSGSAVGLTSLRTNPGVSVDTLAQFVGTNTSNNYLYLYGVSGSYTGFALIRGTIGNPSIWNVFMDPSNHFQIAAAASPYQAVINAVANGDATFQSNGGVSNFAGDIKTSAIGKTLFVKSGTNAKSGTFTLTAGAVTVANTSVTSNSVIVATVKTVGGTQGNWLKIIPTASTGFSVTSESALDTSTYNFVILEVN